MSKFRRKSGTELSELLSAAEMENETARAQTPESIASGETARKSQEDSRYDESVSEANKLMDEYSEKKRKKEETKKQIKSSLSDKLENDRELESYYYGSRKSRLDRSEVKEIYSIINSDGGAFEMDTGEKPEDEENASFVQESFFDSGDDQDPVASPTQQEEEQEREESVNEAQITFGLESEKSGARKNEDADKKLKLAFPMLGEEEDLSEEKANEYRKKKKEARKAKRESRIALEENSVPEYVGANQNDDVYRMLRKASKSSFRRLLAVILFSLGILYLETSTFDSARNVFFRPGRYGALYILIDLQLLLFIAASLLNSLRKGLRGIRNGVLTMESLLVFALLCPAIHCLLALATEKNAPDLKLFCLCGAFSAICFAVSNYLQCRKNIHCFKVVSSKKKKYAACVVEGDAKEADEFYKYLFDGAEIFTAAKTEFISGFFKRTLKRPKSEDVLNLLITGSLLFAVTAGVIHAVVHGGGVASVLNASALMLAAVIPANAFFMITLPVIAANKKGKKYASAFIGNAVTEEYAEAGVISFADTEVFPPAKIKLTSVDLMGNCVIDSLIFDLVKIFRYIGSPLKSVMNNMVDCFVPEPGSIRLIESAENGICVSMDGRDFYLGKRSYMRQYNFNAPRSENDNEYESKKGNVIMYVAIDDEIAAKIYLTYNINKSFDKLLSDMYRAGICVGIKTLDPNIDNSLLSRCINFTKCPITILKAGSPEDMTSVSEKTDSGIVTIASLHTFLNMFVMCDKARHATRSNAIINIAGFVLSFIAVMALIITGDHVNVPSVYAAALQLLWLLPVSVLSFLI